MPRRTGKWIWSTLRKKIEVESNGIYSGRILAMKRKYTMLKTHKHYELFRIGRSKTTKSRNQTRK